jgi:hypothetical protein
MSYYSKYNRNYDLWTAIICFALAIFVMISFNTCTASEWNDGYCPKCNVRYELGGVYKYIKYYSCPKCGNEVSRY